MPPAPGTFPPRYHALDSLRFLAATGVLLHHLSGLDLGVLTARTVTFFVISGYAIAAASQSIVKSGAGIGTFLRRRAARIYLPYFCLLGYFGVMTVQGFTVGSGPERGDALFNPVRWITNATLTQWIPCSLEPRPGIWRRDEFFVKMHWSLPYEIQFYVLAAAAMLLAIRFRVRMAAFAWCFLAAGIAWGILVPRLMFGLAIEYGVALAVGALVFHRLSEARTAGARRTVDAALIVGMLASFAWAWSQGWGSSRRSIPQEFGVSFAIGLVMITFRPLDARWTASRAGRVLGALGGISYALFLAHPVNMVLVAGLAGRVLPAHAPVWLTVGLQAVVHLGLVALFWLVVERMLINHRRRPQANKNPTTVPSTVFLELKPRPSPASKQTTAVALAVQAAE